MMQIYVKKYLEYLRQILLIIERAQSLVRYYNNIELVQQ